MSDSFSATALSRLSPRRVLALSIALLTVISLQACRTPRTIVVQTVDIAGDRMIAGRKVREYHARDFLTLDSTEPILRFEYVPVRIYALLDTRDSIESLVVAGWQEYLWRFSQRLPSIDKQYYLPVPLGVTSSGDSAMIRWGYPSIEGRDNELRDVERRKNSYWSIDIFGSGESFEEAWVGQLSSFPENGGYDPRRRFARGQIYSRSIGDSASVNRRLLDILLKRIEESRADNTP